MVQGGHNDARPSPVVRVVGIDDEPVCARGLQATIDQTDRPVVLVEVFDTVTRLNGQTADVALVEIDLRDGSHPRDNVATLVNQGIAVIAYTHVADAHLLTETLDAGACGVVWKCHPEEVLLEAIQRVHRGETYMPDDVARLLAQVREQRPRLSGREVEVLNLLYRGLITKQAARRLEVSESTVKEHLKRIRQKYHALGRPVSTRVQLLQVAERDGFIDA